MDSQREAQFYQQFVKPSGYRFEVHQRFGLIPAFDLGGYRQSMMAYTPDFVIYDHDGSIKHVYDVKTGVSLQAYDSAAKLRFKVFQQHYRIPIEIVTPRAHDFKQAFYGFTTHDMMDQHAHRDRYGRIVRRPNGEPRYDYYNVFKTLNYDVTDYIGA